MVGVEQAAARRYRRRRSGSRHRACCASRRPRLAIGQGKAFERGAIGAFARPRRWSGSRSVEADGVERLDAREVGARRARQARCCPACRAVGEPRAQRGARAGVDAKAGRARRATAQQIVRRPNRAAHWPAASRARRWRLGGGGGGSGGADGQSCAAQPASSGIAAVAARPARVCGDRIQLLTVVGRASYRNCSVARSTLRQLPSTPTMRTLLAAARRAAARGPFAVAELHPAAVRVDRLTTVTVRPIRRAVGR